MKLKKSIKITIVIAIIITLLIIIFASLISFKIYGSKHAKIEYNTQYIEEGYKLQILGKDYTKKVKITNNIDYSKIGTYKINYTYKLGIFTLTKTRKVSVIDNDYPIITLKGEKEQTICPNTNYIEEGYTVTDNYDGDITDKIKIEDKETYILYSATDSTGNKTEIKRIINKKDSSSPRINLKGNTTTYVNQNEKYVEEGYTALDNCDGDITSKVKIEGKIDTSTLGEYTLTYTVTDTTGNETTATRKIIVKTKSNYVEAGVIYLTFDDGPSASGSTYSILETLKEEGIKATFFVTGSGPSSLIKKAYDEGHTIGLHTYTHDYKTIYKSIDDYYNDLKKIQNRVQNITGYKSYIIRFPGGTSNTVSKKYNKGIMTKLSTSVKQNGYKVFDWNIDASDAYKCARSNVSNKKECVYNNVIKKLSKKRSNIVLMHDTKSYTAEALKDIIKYGKNNGYTFKALSYNLNSYMSNPLN